jgi:hypothetical protein
MRPAFPLFVARAKPSRFTCSGVRNASQRAIASNWIEAYKLYVSANPPVPQVASPTVAATPLNGDQVLVNTNSGKYWKHGSQYYGKTKKGEYLSEEQAVQKGYRAANGTEE